VFPVKKFLGALFKKKGGLIKGGLLCRGSALESAPILNIGKHGVSADKTGDINLLLEHIF